MSFNTRPAYFLEQDGLSPARRARSPRPAQEGILVCPLSKLSQELGGLERCFSNVSACVNHAGIPLTWKLCFWRSGRASDAVPDQLPGIAGATGL